MKRAFTLIELLVTIAIIGILASMVLIGVNGARTKAKDTRVKSSMSQLRTKASEYADKNNESMSGFCADSSIATLLSDINANAKGVNTCKDDALGFATSAELHNPDGLKKYYCVESGGSAKMVSDIVSTYTCPLN